jgi:hypothetical protein
MVAQYSTQMPDGRKLVMRVDEQRGPDVQLTRRLVYEIDGKEVTKAKAEKAWNEQPESWQRGRTLQQALDYWLGRGG